MTFDHFCRRVAIPYAIRPRLRNMTRGIDDFATFMRTPIDYRDYPAEERILFFAWMLGRMPGDPDRLLDRLLDAVEGFDLATVYNPRSYVQSALRRVSEQALY